MTEAAKARIPDGAVVPEGPEPSRFATPDADPKISRSDERPRRNSARIGDQAQVRIGNSLRSLYDNIVQQPVPDRFRDLIARLDAQDPKTP